MSTKYYMFDVLVTYWNNTQSVEEFASDERDWANRYFEDCKGNQNVRRLQLRGYTFVDFNDNTAKDRWVVLMDFLGREQPQTMEYNSMLMGAEPMRSMF